MQLEANHVSFRYGTQQWLFRQANFTIHAGEILGLVGPSGVGKTTFGRTLAGYETPYEGTITLDGVPVSTQGYQPIQLVMQHPEKAVNPKWKMRKTLNEGWEPDEALLAKLGIDQKWLNRWPNELSGGELQRFCVARALGPDTRFLIADEMTTMLDAITQAQIWHAVLEIAKERNMGVLVISHDQHLIHRLCTRIIDFNELLDHGMVRT
ncbi:ATP-binding cassette domain-containing protein [Aquibacillus koreensis]|uniref:ATP-binding cassette domain-containing protein n=1 Tax=Aquibacillus koreensis TaxID=279446 RepID=A0A9X3WSI6_9BACI|nr:ATP-binding cassette domain-containing protein [Aquibacillus koreensis]MCT2534162.1 ATP-binding cassette domain-containing protein [Aquibacillus koreensis]MDC3422554.1 ATP-binding cassette domain-containing protein [Aquibacillus koreensis]